MAWMGPRAGRRVVVGRLALALAVGVVLLVAELPSLYKAVRLIGSGTRVPAEVVEEGSARYFRYAREEAGETRWYFIPLGTVERRWRFRVGDRLPVYVDPDDPTRGEEAHIWNLLAGPLLVVFLGGAGVAIGGTGLIRLLRRRPVEKS